MPLIEPRHRLLFFALFGIFTIFGTFVTIFGATLPKILASLGWSYFTAGLVLGAGSVAYFMPHSARAIWSSTGARNALSCRGWLWPHWGCCFSPPPRTR